MDAWARRRWRPPEHRGPQEPSVRPERRPDRVSAAGRRGRPSGSHDPGSPRPTPVSPLPPPARTLRRGCRRARSLWALRAVCGTGRLLRREASAGAGPTWGGDGIPAAWPGGAVPLLWSLGPRALSPFHYVPGMAGAWLTSAFSRSREARGLSRPRPPLPGLGVDWSGRREEAQEPGPADGTRVWRGLPRPLRGWGVRTHREAPVLLLGCGQLWRKRARLTLEPQL